MPEQPPKKRAIALSYEEGAPAPRVTATGSGLVAERILAAAREAGVPVRSDPALVQALGTLEFGSEVPQALWVAVAETLAWAYKLDAEAGRRQR
ncbi:MAG TPA: EscU/YscU/HrcU family type III secretion system export apparatus switch protein [Solirubrobacteraceae bacterium]|nr:EscU/YscU/HrcU family type III secretion system export apparatus switch protein [Solirubrobacteraceae bacterium]